MMSDCPFYEEKRKLFESKEITSFPKPPISTTYSRCKHPHAPDAIRKFRDDMIGGADSLKCGGDLNSDKCRIPLPREA